MAKLGTVKFVDGNGSTITVPIHSLDNVKLPAFRVETPNGVGAFNIVDPSSADTPIRIETQHGTKGILTDAPSDYQLLSGSNDAEIHWIAGNSDQDFVDTRPSVAITAMNSYDGYAYIGYTDGTLEKVNKKNGALVWSRQDYTSSVRDIWMQPWNESPGTLIANWGSNGAVQVRLDNSNSWGRSGGTNAWYSDIELLDYSNGVIELEVSGGDLQKRQGNGYPSEQWTVTDDYESWIGALLHPYGDIGFAIADGVIEVREMSNGELLGESSYDPNGYIERVWGAVYDHDNDQFYIATVEDTNYKYIYALEMTSSGLNAVWSEYIDYIDSGDPHGITLDNQGYLYVIKKGGDVEKVEPSSYYNSQWTYTGHSDKVNALTANKPSFDRKNDVPANPLYIADGSNIKKINRHTRHEITTASETPANDSAEVHWGPNNNYLYFFDGGDNTWKFDENLNSQWNIGSHKNGMHVGDTYLYLVDDWVEAYDFSGSEQWQYDLSNLYDATYGWSHVVSHPSNACVVSVQEGSSPYDFHVARISNGSPDWHNTYPADDEYDDHTLFNPNNGGYVYLSTDSDLYKLNASNGSTVWSETNRSGYQWGDGLIFGMDIGTDCNGDTKLFLGTQYFGNFGIGTVNLDGTIDDNYKYGYPISSLDYDSYLSNQVHVDNNPDDHGTMIYLSGFTNGVHKIWNHHTHTFELLWREDFDLDYRIGGLLV